MKKHIETQQTGGYCSYLLAHNIEGLLPYEILVIDIS